MVATAFQKVSKDVNHVFLNELANALIVILVRYNRGHPQPDGEYGSYEREFGVFGRSPTRLQGMKNTQNPVAIYNE